MKALNCKQIIVSSFKVAEPLFTDYLEEFKNRLEVAHPGAYQEKVKLAAEEQFVPQVLSDPQSNTSLNKMWEFVMLL